MFRTISIKNALLTISGMAVIAGIVVASLSILAFYMLDQSMRHQEFVALVRQDSSLIDMQNDKVASIVWQAVALGATGAKDRQARLVQAFDQAKTDLDAHFSRTAAADLPAAIRTQLSATRTEVDAFFAAGLRVMQALAEGGAAQDAATAAFEPAFAKLEAELGKLNAQIAAYSLAAHDESRDAVLFFGGLVLAGTAMAVVVMMTTSLKFSRHIVKPIDRMRAALAEVAEGKFDLRLGSITRNDDIGAIARDIDRVSERVVAMMAERDAQEGDTQRIIGALGQGLRDLAQGNLATEISGSFSGSYDSLRMDFNQAAQQLRQSIAEVVAVSDSIRAQSGDLSRASENLATRTENQAATLEETATALEEVTGGMNNAADSAREVEEVVQRARSEVEHSGTIVLSAVTAMHEIEASSSQISQIIGVIDDIAFQTNLLALNAGVEAARAGDAGRGFAVVASEVRALAQRSSTAAKEIKGLIGASAQQVEKGVQQVDQARSALNAVVTQVARISDLVSQIARGSGDQAGALHEINLGVAQLDQVTQQNAAMAEESGAASRAVEEEAIELDKIVSRFTLGRTGAGARGSVTGGARSAPREAGAGWIAA